MKNNHFNLTHLTETEEARKIPTAEQQSFFDKNRKGVAIAKNVLYSSMYAVPFGFLATFFSPVLASAALVFSVTGAAGYLKKQNLSFQGGLETLFEKLPSSIDKEYEAKAQKMLVEFLKLYTHQDLGEEKDFRPVLSKEYLEHNFVNNEDNQLFSQRILQKIFFETIDTDSEKQKIFDNFCRLLDPYRQLSDIEHLRPSKTNAEIIREVSEHIKKIDKKDVHDDKLAELIQKSAEEFLINNYPLLKIEDVLAKVLRDMISEGEQIPNGLSDKILKKYSADVHIGYGIDLDELVTKIHDSVRLELPKEILNATYQQINDILLIKLESVIGRRSVLIDRILERHIYEGEPDIFFHCLAYYFPASKDSFPNPAADVKKNSPDVPNALITSPTSKGL